MAALLVPAYDYVSIKMMALKFTPSSPFSSEVFPYNL
jgi:hypothetical protein